MTSHHKAAEGSTNSGRAPKLSDTIYARIFEQIMNEEFSEGAKLPSESMLAEQFKVSRPVVRDALLRLREDGLIVSHKGAGSFVERRPDQVMLRFAPPESIAEMQRCFEFRVSLEGEAAMLAAERAEPADLKTIDRSITALQQRVAGREVGVEADFGFHLSVARATRNHFFSNYLLSMKAQIMFGQNLARSLGLRNPTTHLLEVQQEHELIRDAIRERDAIGARTAMRTHIGNSRRRVFEGGREADFTG